MQRGLTRWSITLLLVAGCWEPEDADRIRLDKPSSTAPEPPPKPVWKPDPKWTGEPPPIWTPEPEGDGLQGGALPEEPAPWLDEESRGDATPDSPAAADAGVDAGPP